MQALLGPFTSGEAYAAGITPRMLRGPRYRRLFVGVHLAASVEVTEGVRVAAALKVLPPGTLVTGVTALRSWGVDVGSAAPLHFATVHPHPVRRPGLVVSRTSMLPPDRGSVVIPEYAFVSAAPHLNLLELVSAGDRLVRLERCRLADLTAYASGYTGPRAAHARRAAALVRERVDSLRETRLRLALIVAGLPEPVCNPRVGTDDGPIGRVDLVYWAYRVLIEYEGDQHRTDRYQWNLDIDRAEAFARENLALVRITAARMRRPREVVRRVHEAICEGGYAGSAPVFGAEWRALFEA